MTIRRSTSVWPDERRDVWLAATLVELADALVEEFDIVDFLTAGDIAAEDLTAGTVPRSRPVRA